MITIERKHLATIEQATTAHDLWASIQAAIELEHSTIPPYLTALFSLKPGANRDAAEIIESVVVEEMLHMTIAANLLNAVGGSPRIADPSFTPSYPGPLPMGVHQSLSVGLEKASRRLIHDVFMAIEEPEHPLDIPDGRPQPAALLGATRTQYATIGEFYRAMIDKLRELDGQGSAFPDPPRRQVTDERWYPESVLFPIVDLASAERAIGVIVEQGEGTASSPLDADEVAHYYRFGEIVHGRRLVRTEAEPGWAYAGEPVGIDPSGVWDLVTDAKAADYAVGTRVRVLVDMANAAYTRLLVSLHRMFNGEPDQLAMALSIMIEMRLTVQKLVATPVPGTNRFAAPTFEWAAAGLS